MPADAVRAELKQEKERFAAMVLEFGELKDAAERRAESAESEVTRLTEALAAAERQAVRIEEKASSYFARAEAAESRVRLLESELAGRETRYVSAQERAIVAESECAALRAEVERLRADIERFSHGKLATRCDAAESRLAAANTLLECGVSALGEGPEELDSWQADAESYLAAQPATAPARGK